MHLELLYGNFNTGLSHSANHNMIRFGKGVPESLATDTIGPRWPGSSYDATPQAVNLVLLSSEGGEDILRAT